MARILSRTESAMVYEISRQRSGIGTGLFFLGGAILSTYFLVTTATFSTLTCRKGAAPEAQCTYSTRNRLRPNPPLIESIIDQVKGAEAKTIREEYEDSDGDTRVRVIHQFYVRIPSGKLQLFNDQYTTLGAEASSFANALNTFISSPRETTLTLRSDNISANTVFTLFAASGAGFLGVLIILRGVLVIPLREILTLDRPTRTITHTYQKMLTKESYSYPFAAAFVHVDYNKDSYNNIQYQSTVTLPGNLQVVALYTPDAYIATAVAEELANFLEKELPPLPEIGQVTNVTAAPPTDPRQQRLASYQELYRSSISNYMGSELDRLPESSSFRLIATDQELNALGFKLLGEFISSKYSDISIYSYVSPESEAIALLLETQSSLYCEFYTEFRDGASYTTSTLKLLIRSFPWLKIYHFSYPRLSLRSLWQKHQELIIQSRRTVRYVLPNLRAIARSCDDYLTRESKIPMGRLVALVNGLYAVFNK